jgi:hypothetical protein
MLRSGRSLLDKCENLLLIELVVCPTYGISTYICFFFSSIVVVVVVVVAVVGDEVVSAFFVSYLLRLIPV